MKKSILLLVFTALVLFLSGQYSRPKPIEFDRDIADLISCVDSAYFIIFADTIGSPPLKTDTVNILLMVCDTTEILYIHTYFVDVPDQYNVAEIVTDTLSVGNYDNNVRWIFAREVRSLSDIYGVRPYHYKFIQKDGSDLPKGYFVWDYKYLDK